MKRAAIAAVAALTLACAAPAGATTQKLSPTEQRLQRQITALQGQVAALKKQVTKLKKDTTTATDVGFAALAFSVCNAAATVDTFTSTWAVIDQIAQGTQGKAYIGAQPGVSDQGACQALEDVDVLVRCLKHGTTDVRDALLRYESERRRRAEDLVALSRRGVQRLHAKDELECVHRSSSSLSRSRF